MATPGGVVVEALLLRVTLGEPPSLEFPYERKIFHFTKFTGSLAFRIKRMPEILNVFEVKRTLKNLLKITWKAFFDFIYLN